MKEAVRITGWRGGLNKVGLTKLLMRTCDLGLKAARHQVDEVLEGRSVTLVLSDEVLGGFLREAAALGAEVQRVFAYPAPNDYVATVAEGVYEHRSGWRDPSASRRRRRDLPRLASMAG